MSGGLDPGCVRVRLAVRDGRVEDIAVSSERPQPARALAGRDADEAVRLVPLLFALCGKAQGSAARLALAAARGVGHPSALDAAIEREAMREHLWRWLLDLPALVGRPPRRDAFIAGARAIAEGRRGELLALLDGDEVAELSRRLGGLDDIAEGGASLLPPLDATDSLACWPRIDARLCNAPDWRGKAAETGALARRASARSGAGAIATRWTARLGELRDWADGTARVGAGGTAGAVPVALRRGRALVETARGLLMHEVEVDAAGKVIDYAIVAPTEWNFHPDGTLAGWFRERPVVAPEDLAGLVARAVGALDPCVRWELERTGW